MAATDRPQVIGEYGDKLTMITDKQWKEKLDNFKMTCPSCFYGVRIPREDWHVPYDFGLLQARENNLNLQLEAFIKEYVADER